MIFEAHQGRTLLGYYNRNIRQQQFNYAKSNVYYIIHPSANFYSSATSLKLRRTKYYV